MQWALAIWWWLNKINKIASTGIRSPGVQVIQLRIAFCLADSYGLKQLNLWNMANNDVASQWFSHWNGANNASRRFQRASSKTGWTHYNLFVHKYWLVETKLSGNKQKLLQNMGLVGNFCPNCTANHWIGKFKGLQARTVFLCLKVGWSPLAST